MEVDPWHYCLCYLKSIRPATSSLWQQNNWALTHSYAEMITWYNPKKCVLYLGWDCKELAVQIHDENLRGV
jgi:hypothetical protein